MSTDAEAKARALYERMMSEYRDAVVRRDPTASTLFEDARGAWEHLRSFGGKEATAPAEGHVVVAFCIAVGANNTGEAKRLYESMSPEYRRQADMADARTYLSPGFMKIWLRRSRSALPFSDAVLEQSDPTKARAAAAYEYWRFECDKSESVDALQSLGLACEQLDKFDEARAAYQRALELATNEEDDALREALELKVRILNTH